MCFFYLIFSSLQLFLVCILYNCEANLVKRVYTKCTYTLHTLLCFRILCAQVFPIFMFVNLLLNLVCVVGFISHSALVYVSVFSVFFYLSSPHSHSSLLSNSSSFLPYNLTVASLLFGHHEQSPIDIQIASIIIERKTIDRSSYKR